MKESYSIDDINSSSIVFIANHFLESGLSLRAFANQFCEFSHVTLREKFLRVLPNIKNDLYFDVCECLKNNRTKNINDDKIAQIRVLKAVDLFLNKNMFIHEVAEELNTTVMVIYRDLTRRLMEMDNVSSDIKKQVLVRLEEHSLQNLIVKGSR